MRRRRFLAALGLVVAAGLSACGQQGNTAGANQQAAERFLTERNNGTPVALGANAGASNTAPVGTVERVEGRTIEVQGGDGKRTTIQLAADAKISRLVEVQPSEIKAGDLITVFGTRNGAVLEARSIQIGDLGGEAIVVGGKADALPQSGGAPVKDPSKQGGEAQIITSNGDGLPAESMVSGTVERVEGQTLVVKDREGSSTTVQLSDTVEVFKRAMAEVSAIVAGTFIVARGTQQGDVFQATQVEILPSPTP